MLFISTIAIGKLHQLNFISLKLPFNSKIKLKSILKYADYLLKIQYHLLGMNQFITSILLYCFILKKNLIYLYIHKIF